MADTPQTLTTVANALAQNFRDKIVRTINRKAAALRLLSIVAGEGKNCAWDVELDGMVGESFVDAADAANFGSDDLQPATLPWSGFRTNFRLGDIAQAAAATSRSPNGLLNMLGRNVLNGAAKMASLINAAVYNGTGTIVGFDTAIKNDNTYGTIDRTQAANASFRGNVMDPGVPTALLLSDIRNDLNVKIFKACGEVPQIALCAPEVYNVVGGLFQEQRRNVDPIREITTARGRIILDGSIGGIEFEGCVFFKDKDATAGSIYYINTDAVRLEYLPQPMGGMLPEQSTEQQLDDGFGAIPLGMKVKVLGAGGASRKITCQSIVQLVVEKPNACGRRANILTP